MATTKPRITVTLEPQQYDILRRLAALQGRPMARIVTELMEEMLPLLGRAVEAMELAQKAQGNVRESLRRAVEKGEETILPHAQAVLAQYEAFGAELGTLGQQLEEATAGAGQGDASAAARPAHAGESPRPVTTGATGGQRKARKSARGSGRGAALEAGQRVRMRRSGRTGDVVKVYADGSAAIHWDHGEPQGEGLAHERVPGHLLVVTMEAGR